MRKIEWDDKASPVYVAVLDIMGFKNMVKNNSHEQLKRIYEFNILDTTFLSDLPYGMFHNTPRYKSLGGNERTDVRFSLVSDTIIIWTLNDSMKAFIDIIFSVDHILTHSFYKGVPMRGGISIGNLSWHTRGSGPSTLQTILVGRPIVEAYELSDIQNWVGCIIDPKCIDRYRALEKDSDSPDSDNLTMEYLLSSKILIEYAAPLKSGRIEKQYIPNWTISFEWRGYFGNQNIKYRSIEEIVRWAFSSLEKDSNDWSVETKILNTLKFIHDVTGLNVTDTNMSGLRPASIV